MYDNLVCLIVFGYNLYFIDFTLITTESYLNVEIGRVDEQVFRDMTDCQITED